MKTTRQRILEFLKIRQLTTAREISQALHMTAANARHHLSALVEEGVVITSGQRPTQGRGRPTLIYQLARPASSHNLDRLASALLERMLGSLRQEEKQAALQTIARQLAEPATSQRNPSQRLYEAIQRLNEMNYHARWEAHAAAPRVILAHCPYAAILPQYPELCQMDAHLLAALSGEPVTQLARLEITPQGQPQCVFKIGS